jgi:uncharacterized delta-60 repeat protein
MKTIFTNILILLTVFAGNLTAQPAGTLDVTFNGTGKVVYDKDNIDLYQDVKVQPDGKIIAAGTYMTPTYSAGIEVTRYMPDGTFDPTFGTGGHYDYFGMTESGAYKCLIDTNGKILICGYTTDYTLWTMLLIRLNADGTPDPSFGANGIVTQDIGNGEDVAYAMALQEDGKILVAGYSQDLNYLNAPVVVRFTDAGLLDNTFGTGGVATVPVTESDNDFSAVSVQPDGKIMAAGHISNGLSWFSLLVARFDQDGILDPGYGTNGVVNLNLGNVDDEFYDMQLTENKEAILTGFTVTQGDLYYHLLLMKFDSTGQPVTTFGNNGIVISGDVPYTFGDALVLQTDGKILVAGCTGELLPSNNDWALWRFNQDGSPDPDFGTNGLVTTEFFGNADEALGIALFEDKIILAGKTRNAANKLDFAVARYLNDIGVSIAENTDIQNFKISPNPVKRNGTVNLVFELTQAGNIPVELVNFSGNTIKSFQTGTRTAGSHLLQFVMPENVSEGIYFVRIGTSQQLFNTQKVVVID